MTDRRFFRANGRIGHDSLQGQVTDRPLTAGTTLRIRIPVADLCASPGGKRDKQLLFGQAFTLLEERHGWAFGFDPADGYVGYLRADTLHEAPEPTHRITARSSHIYTLDDIKSPDRLPLSCFSEIPVAEESDCFAELVTGGFIPSQHIAPLDWQAEDPVAVAEGFLGTPYLWGGNSTLGIDCSGLVQLAFHAAGRACPRDSDLQAGSWDDAEGAPQRGDLVFWKGHVAMMLSETDMIHANAHHMAVAIEPFATARDRIAQKEFGEILRIARP